MLPHHTNLCKTRRVCVAISSLVFNKLHLNLATLLIVWGTFSRVDGFSLAGPMQSKVEKTLEGSIIYGICLCYT